MAYPILKYLLWPVFSLFVKKIEGIENLQDKPCIYVSNHQSYIDGPLMILMLAWHKNKKVHTFALRDGFNGLIWNLLFNHFGAIRVNGSVNKALKKIKQGKQLLLFPEGRRCKKEQIQQVKHKGLGVIALKAKIPIVPIGIDSYHFWNRKMRMPRFNKRITIVIGKPIQYKYKPTEKSYIKTTEFAMKEVKKLAKQAHNSATS